MSKECAKVGDMVRIRSLLEIPEELHGKICLVLKVHNTDMVTLADGPHEMYAYQHQCEVISKRSSLLDEKAKPGDTIAIAINDPCWVGKTYVVIEQPASTINNKYPHGVVWFRDEVGVELFVKIGDYVIVRRAETESRSAIDVDASLKQQLDDNLRSIFG